MVIIAWNDSGSLSNIFDGDVFKKVLSIFITAAILKLAQGKIKPRKMLTSAPGALVKEAKRRK
jgi:hypothetical protein